MPRRLRLRNDRKAPLVTPAGVKPLASARKNEASASLTCISSIKHGAEGGQGAIGKPSGHARRREATAEIKASNVFAFQCGITAVLGMAAAAAMVRYSSALRDENSLRRQYVKENDERMKAIRAKAGMPLNLAFAVALMVAGTVLGYCNELIFVTLIAVAAAQLLTAAVVKLIFMRVT